MMNVCEKAIKYLPMFFDSQLQFDTLGAGIFEPFRQILDFDEGYVFFLNPDSIQVKYAYGKDKKYSVDDVLPIDMDIKRDLFNIENMILDSKNPLIQLLNLENKKSFLTSKLIIRQTVYGFILLCKNEKEYYNTQDIDVATAVGSIIAYKIKDVELSDIFRIQLQALKDGLNQTKLAYKTIKEQNFKILESDKIRNEFLANISHELRTPLNAIIGFSESLSNKLFGDLNEKQTEYVNDINISGIHLLGMINGILDISKIESRAMTLNRTNFLLSQAVDEVMNVVTPLANKKLILLQKNILQDDYVFADFQKIKQILYNLLSNAIKFTNDKGKIIVKVKFSKQNFTIEVCDNGMGIAKKDQSKIFEKFIQLENAYTKKESSTGLGLTITKELVEMHKGEISIKSDLNKGATFIVKIPLLTLEDLERMREEQKEKRLLRRAELEQL